MTRQHAPPEFFGTNATQGAGDEAGYFTTAAAGTMNSRENHPDHNNNGPSALFHEWVSSTFSDAAAAAPSPAFAPASLGGLAPFPKPQSQQTSLKVPGGTPTTLDAEESANVRVFRDSTPSVVFITNKVLQRDGYNLDATAVPQGAGTGFVYDDKGHIVTNFHVVKGASELTVTFQGDSKVYEAKVLGFDADKDIAVLKIDGGNNTIPRPLPLGCSAALKVGQKVYAIGNPFGLDHTLVSLYKYVRTYVRTVSHQSPRQEEICI